MKLLPMTVILLALSASAHAQEYLIDGVWDEWTGPPIATDPAGDATGAFDITTVYAEMRGTRLFLAWDANADVNTQAGNFSDGTVIIELDLGVQGLLTIDLRAREALLDEQPVRWPDIGYETMPTHVSDTYETTIDLATYAGDDTLAFTLNFRGSDTLGAPITLETNDDPYETPARTHERLRRTDLRIASFNTLNSGLGRPGIDRLLDSVDPDVIALQEEYGSLSGVLRALDRIDPLDDGRPWNGVKISDTVVASPYPVLLVPPVPGAGGNVGAIVDLGFGDTYYIASVHPPCCGFAGSGSDNGRVFEMQAIARQIEALRSADLGSEFKPYADAPAIVIGDWNLVGSTAPLEVMTEPGFPAQVDWPLQHLAAPSIVTWRNPNGFSFSPGRLDLVSHDTTLLRRNGYLLDTQRVPQGVLDELGLLAEDALESDHLLMVADFGRFAAGDTNDDGRVDLEDLYLQDETDVRDFLRRRERDGLR